MANLKLFLTLRLFLVGLMFGCLPSSGAADSTRDETIRPLVTTAELVVGTNRFAFGLLKDGKLIERANVKLRLYSLSGSEAKLAAEVQAPYQTVSKVKQEVGLHRHSDGTAHLHGDDALVRGIYVTQLGFSHAGDWGVELLVNRERAAVETVRLAITVLDASTTPAVGSAAPRSRNPIARDVKNLREIDTSPKPDARLHQVRIADAIAQRKPQLIVFATPQFCTSRMCGPVVEVVRSLLPAFGKRVAFTHQEIWQDFAAKKMFPTVEEWRLDTEPWIFLVDRDGIIRTKFEGLVTSQELESALQQILTGDSAPRR